MNEVARAERLSQEDVVARLTETAQVALEASVTQPVIDGDYQIRKIERADYSVYSRLDNLYLTERTLIDAGNNLQEYELKVSLDEEFFHEHIYEWKAGGDSLQHTDKLLASSLEWDRDTSDLTESDVQRLEEYMKILRNHNEAQEEPEPEQEQSAGIIKKLARLVFRRGL
jgi:hypothetical protein